MAVSSVFYCLLGMDVILKLNTILVCKGVEVKRRTEGDGPLDDLPSQHQPEEVTMHSPAERGDVVPQACQEKPS